MSIGSTSPPLFSYISHNGYLPFHSLSIFLCMFVCGTGRRSAYISYYSVVIEAYSNDTKKSRSSYLVLNPFTQCKKRHVFYPMPLKSLTKPLPACLETYTTNEHKHFVHKFVYFFLLLNTKYRRNGACYLRAFNSQIHFIGPRR